MGFVFGGEFASPSPPSPLAAVPSCAIPLPTAPKSVENRRDPPSSRAPRGDDEDDASFGRLILLLSGSAHIPSLGPCRALSNSLGVAEGVASALRKVFWVTCLTFPGSSMPCPVKSDGIHSLNIFAPSIALRTSESIFSTSPASPEAFSTSCPSWRGVTNGKADISGVTQCCACWCSRAHGGEANVKPGGTV